MLAFVPQSHFLPFLSSVFGCTGKFPGLHVSQNVNKQLTYVNKQLTTLNKQLTKVTKHTQTADTVHLCKIRKAEFTHIRADKILTKIPSFFT
jgi:hypothetical protein